MPVMGRITGSASIETLVRVGIEKENGFRPDSKMVVIHDFKPCVDDELEVKRGQVVNVLYTENDWVYVVSEDDREKEGFIPNSYCAAYGTQQATLILNMKKKMPRDNSLLLGGGVGLGGGGGGGPGLGIRGNLHPDQHEPDHNSTSANNMTVGKINQGLEQSDTDSFQDSSLKLNVRGGQSRSSSLLSESSSQPEIHPFFKDSFGKFIVLYSYHAQDENDLSVERGQLVTLLNKDDPEWLWVVRSDGHEGFVPAGFIYPLDAIQKQQHMNMNLGSSNGMSATSGGSIAPPPPPPLSSSGGGSGPSSLSPGTIGGYNSLQPGPQPQPGGQGGQPPQGYGGGGGGGVPPPLSSSQSQSPADFRYSGTELVMLYDYKAQAPDDLSVRRGDWVYADLNNQTVDGWLWAYAPKTRKYGFIPKAYARPPAMTSL